MVILDTDILIQFSKGAPNIVEKIAVFEEKERLFTTVFNVEEYLFGLEKKHIENASNFLSRLEILPYSYEEVEKVVELRKKMKTKGTPIGRYDEAIAGICLAHDEKFYTLNKKQYERVDGLKLV